MVKIINKALFLALIMFGIFFVSVAYADSSQGVVCLSSGTLNVRSGEGTSFSKVGSLANGVNVTIISTDGDWEHIQCGSIDGYVSGQYIKETSTTPTNGNAATYGTRYTSGSVTSLNVRSGPGTNYSKIASLNPATPVQVIDKQGDWAELQLSSGATGWVAAVYLDIGVPTLSSRSGGSSVDGARLAAYASSSTFLGIPYKYGGASLSGFDCSGFTMYVYKQFGITLPHSSGGQYGYGISVAKSDLQPGDLVFFKPTSGANTIGHVGIYIGDSQFVDAHTYGQPLGISDLNTASYAKRYYGARRLLN